MDRGKFLFLVFCVSSFMRFFRYWEKEYWFDEISSLPITPNLILSGAGDFLFRSIMFLMLKIGDSEAITRLPSILSSILSLFFIYKIYKKWNRLEIFYIYSFLFYPIHLGMEARPYIIAFLFYTIFLYLLISKKNILLITLFATLSTLTYNSFIFYIITALTFFLNIKKILLISLISSTIPAIPNIIFYLYEDTTIVAYIRDFLKHTYSLNQIYDELIFLLKVYSGGSFFFPFKIYFFLLFLGTLISIRKKEFYIFFIPSIITLFFTFFSVRLFAPRHILPFGIFQVVAIYEATGFLASILSLLLKKIGIEKNLSPLKNILISIYIFFNFLNWIQFQIFPTLYNAPIEFKKLIQKANIKDKDIIAILPPGELKTTSENKKALILWRTYFTFVFSFYLKDKEVKFIVENASVLKEVNKIIIHFPFRFDKHKVITLDKLKGDEDVLVVKISPSPSSRSSMVHWWALEEEIGERINEYDYPIRALNISGKKVKAKEFSF